MVERLPLMWRIRSWIAGVLFLTAGRLDPTYDVWLDNAEPRHPTAPERRCTKVYLHEHDETCRYVDSIFGEEAER